MHVQQLELKLYVTEDTSVDQAALIPIFHRWIQEKRMGDDVLLIDVADYRHVPEGPGVMIIGHAAQWRMDEADQTGLVFARKRDELGAGPEKLSDAAVHLLRAAVALEGEPDLRGAIRFGGDRLRVTVMSRRAASGDAASFEAFEPDLRAFAETLWPGTDVTVEQVNSGREALSAELRAADGAPLGELLDRL